MTYDFFDMGGNYNTAHVGNNEIFDHRRRTNVFEIEELQEHERTYDYNNHGYHNHGYNNHDYNNHGYNNHNYNNHGYNNHGYNNQVQQMYHNNNHYNDGYRDYDRNDRNNQGIYVPEQVPFAMDQEELVQVSASIQLNSTRNVNSLLSTLNDHYQLRCSIDRDDVLTVTGPIPRSKASDGPKKFLNIVRRLSNDRRVGFVHR